MQIFNINMSILSSLTKDKVGLLRPKMTAQDWSNNEVHERKHYYRKSYLKQCITC
jgi:hypothetical protein